MTELGKNSVERLHDAAAYAVSLLHHYGFELGGYTIAQLLLTWQEHYRPDWIRLATIEALYQGRYKAVSVEQILALWQRRGQPLYHFNHEFERLVCENLPDSILLPAPSLQRDSAPRTGFDAKLPYHSVALQLPSFGGAVLPESDVMLALKTLHSKEMAALTEAQTHAEASQQALLPTYSYRLQADEQSTPDANSGACVQTEVDSPVLSLENADASLLETADEAVQNEPIALIIDPAQQTQHTTTEPSVDNAAALPLPASEVPASISQIGSIARILQQLDDQALNAKAALPGFGLMADMLKPKLQLHLTAHYQPIWLADSASKQPIHQFAPNPEQSEFHNRLKAVAQRSEEPDNSDSTRLKPEEPA